MSKTISQAKDELAAMLHGTTLNKIENLNGVFNRAARELLLDFDPVETRRVETITNALYNDVYNYSTPADLKGDHVIEIRLTADVQDEPIKQFTQSQEKYFTVNKDDYSFNVQSNSGEKFIRISRDVGKTTIVDKVDGININGIWSVSGDASNLLVDDINYVSGIASLKFDSSGATGVSTIENTTLTSSDLSDYEEVGSFFLWVYLPASTSVTSMTLNWGNDLTTNYWEDTVTDPHFGSFKAGWNLMRFDWDGATENGTVDSTAIDSVSLVYNTPVGTAINNLRLDNILCKYGRYYEMPYYSKYLFQSSANTWKEETDNDNDIINLDTYNFNLYMYKVAEMAAAQINDNKDDVAYFASKYNSTLKELKKQYSSQREKKSQPYYKF
jgi:hypothetical protein